MKLDEITLLFNKISSKKNKKLDCKLKFKFTPSGSGIQKERLVKRIQYIEK